jgi:hypothetical protein
MFAVCVGNLLETEMDSGSWGFYYNTAEAVTVLCSLDTEVSRQCSRQVNAGRLHGDVFLQKLNITQID